MSKFGEWVSVEDRMPDERVEVLITVITDNGVFVDIAWRENGGWNDPLGGWSNDDVTHWMLLPEPPQEVTEDERDHGVVL